MAGATKPPMSPAEWNEIALRVRDAMAEAVWPTVTPLARTIDTTHGEALGSGTYFGHNGSLYLLTAEHVIREAGDGLITHLPINNGNYYALNGHFQRAPWPAEVAWTRIPQWPVNPSNRNALSLQVLDTQYAPTEDELFFWLGFPGTTLDRHDPPIESRRRRALFGVLESRGLPMITQAPRTQTQLEGFDPSKHTIVHYPDAAVSTLGGPPGKLPHPSGMSGSLLWDTKFVWATQNDVDWHPQMARVCGLIWAASEDPDFIVATRVETVRPFLLQFLREEAAYFSWTNRGCPPRDDLHDWLLAERMLQDLS